MQRFMQSRDLRKVEHPFIKLALMNNLARVVPLMTSVLLMVVGAQMIIKSQLTIGALVLVLFSVVAQ